MNEKKERNSFWFSVIVSFLIIVALCSVMRIKASAADDFRIIGSGSFEYQGETFTYYRGNYVEILNDYYYHFSDDVYFLPAQYGDTAYQILICVSKDSFSYSGNTSGNSVLRSEGVYFASWSGSVDVTYPSPCSFIGDIGSDALVKAFCEHVASDEFEEIKELPDLSKYTLNDEYRLTGFTANNSIRASWSGSTASDCGYTDEYNIIEFIYEPRASYDYVNSTISTVYEDTVDISIGSFFISWLDVQHENNDYYLSAVKVTPIGSDATGLMYKGQSSFALFDAYGSFLGATTPTIVDTDSFTDNIAGAVYDSTIPSLSNLSRSNNGYANPLESYSQSVTFRWADYFDDSSYYIQVRTTFRYKLNADSVWEEVTVDTSLPLGRFSCLVDAQEFTYTYGDYAELFWQQDDNIMTADDLNKQGNLQPIKDSIRIVKFTDGVATCGKWTTFTLKNGIWETGEVTGSYESESLDDKNNSVNIPNLEEGSENFLVDFDFSNVSSAWDAFTSIFKNLINFLGEFPILFAQIFSFLPYEIRTMIYISMISICVIGLCKAVIH